MNSFRTFRRDTMSDNNNDRVLNLLIAIVSLVFTALIIVGVLVSLRRSRQRRLMRMHQMDDTLPVYEFKGHGNPHGLTVQTGPGIPRQSLIIVRSDGQPMLANPHAPPHSPDNVPQIHITFPDEQDNHGRPKSGRVVVVRVGDNGVGMEPLRDEQLPAYEKDSSLPFYSIDMNDIGGLKEKDRSNYH